MDIDLTRPLSLRIVFAALCLVAVFSGASISAQDAGSAGHLHGRLLSAYGLKPIGGAQLEVLVDRNGRAFRIGAGRSDPSGRFEFRMEPTVEEPQLVIKANGFAPRRLALITPSRGEGILLPDLIMDVGNSVEFSLAAEGIKLHKHSRVELRFPLHDSHDIDLESTPLISIRIQGDKVTIPNVPPGPVLFVFRDGFTEFAPKVVPWRMGPKPVSIGPVALFPGLSLTSRIKAKKSRRVAWQAHVGSGVFSPDGGEEYRFLWRGGCKMLGPGVHEAELKQIPEGLVELNFEGTDEGLKIATVGGRGLEARELIEASVLEGRLRIDGSNDPIVGATVRIGVKSARTNEKGDYRIRGLLPGHYRLSATARGMRPVENRAVVVRPESRIPDVDLFSELLPKVRGEVLDRDRKPAKDVWVLSEPSRSDMRRSGSFVVARSGDQGRYAGFVDPSAVRRLIALAANGMRNAGDPFPRRMPRLMDADFTLRESASGVGKVTLDSRAPAKGCDVFIVSNGVEPRRLVSSELVPRPLYPGIAHVLTDPEGVFRFRGLEKGPHRIVVKRPGAPVFISDPVNLATGENRIGLDVRLPKVATSALIVAAGRPYRLVPKAPGAAERWFSAANDKGEYQVADLSPGGYRVEPLWFFETIAESRRILRGSPGDHEMAGATRVRLPVEGGVISEPEIPYGRLNLDISILGRPPGTNPVVLTLYPRGGVAGQLPLRLAANRRDGKYELELPRGLYVLHADVPEGGAVVTPPFRVGMNEEEAKGQRVSVDVRRPLTLQGFVEFDDVERDEHGMIEVLVDHRSHRGLQPWTLPKPSTALDASGYFDLAGIPEERGELLFAGQGFVGRFSFFESAGSFADLGAFRLDEVPAAPVELPSAEIRGAGLPAGQTGDLVPGRYESAWFTSLRFVDGPLLGKRRMLSDLAPRITDPRAASRRRGRLFRRETVPQPFSERLRIGGARATNWPYTLIPLVDDAYRYDQPVIIDYCSADGMIRHEMNGGSWVLRLEFDDPDGHLYRHHHFFEFTSRERRISNRLDVDFGELPVLCKDPQTEQPVPGATVRVHRADMRGAESVSVFRGEASLVVTGTTDDRGRVVFGALPPGTYDLKVSSWIHGETIRRDVVVTKKPRRKDLEVTLSTGGGLSVSLRDDSGFAVPDASLFLFDPEGSQVLETHRLNTDAAGRLRVSGLAIGNLTVFAQAEGFPPQFLGEVTVGFGTEAILDETLVPGAPVRVVCHDEDGRFIPDARIRISADSGGLRLHTAGADRIDELPSRSNAAGELHIKSFPQGPYKIDVEATGYDPAAVEGTLEGAQPQEIVVVLKKNPRRKRTR